ncbi:MAG: hypothetical protein NTX05_00760 [Fusobacteria bacterium]|nr:hypothetical protein [Fusobacteriota bacterium]
MSIQKEFENALQQSFSTHGLEPKIEMNIKGNVQLEVSFELDTNKYCEQFDFVEIECFLRNKPLIYYFTKRVCQKLYFAIV